MRFSIIGYVLYYCLCMSVNMYALLYFKSVLFFSGFNWSICVTSTRSGFKVLTNSNRCVLAISNFVYDQFVPSQLLVDLSSHPH